MTKPTSKPKTAPPKRDYKSALRERQSEETRERIVEAIVAQLYDHGLGDFSVADIAARAGVSERTVYRYFPTRDDLLRSVEERWRQTMGPEGLPVFKDLRDIVAAIAPGFQRFEANKAQLEALLVSGLGRKVDDWMRRRRIDATLDALTPLAPHLDPDEFRRRVYVLRNLFGYVGWRFLTRDCGLSNDDATRATEWATRLLIEDTVAADKKAKKQR